MYVVCKLFLEYLKIYLYFSPQREAAAGDWHNIPGRDRFY